ncbi:MULTISPECIES: PH domain-containing protein [unclassified Brevibacillus]|uniref:PH domain-containing protein n=1 Tax=unclassified Brevibacillus TaxID=2684853 RepID=UPI001C2D797B|nr:MULTISPECIES: PH domain-containing protein [unclassified Brevibacillus]
MEAKRYHLLNILFDLITQVKHLFFPALILFVFNRDSTNAFITYGRIVFYIYVVGMLVYLVLKWFSYKYRLDDTAFHLYQGIFTKTKQTIPFAKIQNVNRHTTLLHRIFKVTSIRFETGMVGDDSTVEFAVISFNEADRLEAYTKQAVRVEKEPEAEGKEGDATSLEEIGTPYPTPERIIHFTPTKKEIIKASFTSLSFLGMITLLVWAYFKLTEYIDVEEQVVGIYSLITSSWTLITLTAVGLLVLSIVFGMVTTYIRYGKYEISSDHERIYIAKGVIEETAFSIAKERVQAIKIKQSLLKRMLGLAEVKLTVVGGDSDSEKDKQDVSSLYPFLPVKRAYEMISEILPAYEVTEEMTSLPIKSLWIRLVRSCWIWMIGTGALSYFKPNILGWEQAWWIISIALTLFVLVFEVIEFYNTRYTLNDHFIQFQTGSLTTTLFVSKREKIIEVNVKRDLLQKQLGLASIKTVNRAKPVSHKGVTDVPIELAEGFYQWYMGRRKEIKVE